MNTDKAASGCHPAVIEQRIKDLDKRKDMVQVRLMWQAGMLDPFQVVDRITAIALSAGIDAPARLN